MVREKSVARHLPQRSGRRQPKTDSRESITGIRDPPWLGPAPAAVARGRDARSPQPVASRYAASTPAAVRVHVNVRARAIAASRMAANFGT